MEKIEYDISLSLVIFKNNCCEEDITDEVIEKIEEYKISSVMLESDSVNIIEKMPDRKTI